ncbi:MAG TPA: GlsB/YeaQ/YmgE family stress response membrane protein [Rhodothermales bacterium]|nr:GlsB/YeaQ/YmgE family stress response membrane protein [Rhodothermales bacterium]
MLTSLIAWVVLGAIAGFLARAIMPGTQNLSLGMTIVLGIVGALVGGLIMWFVGGGSGRDDGDVINWGSVVVATLGALLVLFLYGRTRRGTTV